MTGRSVSHYQIVEKLGEGGMGTVYRAQDTILERTVAVKVLAGRIPADETARARLLREARTASSLNHPSICTVYEVGEAGGQTFIAMEYIEGRPLSALIPAEGLPPDQVLRYGMQIAEALAHSHDRGVVHRDLKSSNVMVTPEGRIKVLDFGLAKRLAEAAEGEEATRTQKDSLTREGSIVGTLSYMSPEALRGEPVEARSDLWSFGVLLYEMATGRLPFEGRSLFEVTAAVLRGPVPELPAGVGAGLRAIVQRCLDREPGQRYQRGGEVRAAIEAIQSASRVPAAVAAPPLSRRRFLLLVPLLMLLLLVGSIVIHWQRNTPLAPPGSRVSTGARASRVAEANEYFEKALHFMLHQYDLMRARPMFERALQLDPHFAEARAWYGFTHVLMLESGHSNDTGWLYKAEEEVRRALRDDPNSGRAHSALAAVYVYQGRKELVPPEAERAIKINPRDVDAYNWLGNYHWLNGDYPAAQALMRKLIELDPLFFVARMNLGDYLREQGDIDGAIREQEKVLEQDPQNLYGTLYLARAYMDQGDLPRAAQTLDRVRPNDRQTYQWRMNRALLLALQGNRGDALKEMDGQLLKYGATMVSLTSYVADFYAVLRDTAQALEWLDRAVRAGDERAEWFQRNPLLASIRDEPRFRQILASIRYRREQRTKATR